MDSPLKKYHEGFEFLHYALRPLAVSNLIVDLSTMQKTEHISLRWDEFGEHTVSTFAHTKGDKDFFDVTLVSGDGASLYLIFVFFSV